MIPESVYRTARKVVPEIFRQLLADRNIKTATKYLLPGFTVRITRQMKPDNREKRNTYLLSVGGPNYAERLFVKDALAAKVPFPVRKVQLRHYPVPRVKKTKKRRGR